MKGATESLQGRTVYLAGPMRGYPRYNFDAFELGAAELRRRGINVVSPAEMDLALGFDPDRTLEEQGFDVDDALRRDFEAIATVDAIVFMDGAQRSSGCLAEYEVARALDLPVYSLERCHIESGGFCLRSWTRQGADRMLHGRRSRVPLQAIAIVGAALVGSWASTWAATFIDAVQDAASLAS